MPWPLIQSASMPQNAAALSLFLLLIVLPPAGCHLHETSGAPVPEDGVELPILSQINGQHSHETRAMRLVIRDPETLARVPLADVPVNFAQEMVLIVTLGRMTSDQYSVSIDRVWREGSRLKVETTVHAPPDQSRPGVSSSYAMAVIPRCDLNVAGFSSEPPARTRSWEQSEPPEGFGSAPKSKKPAKVGPKSKH